MTKDELLAQARLSLRRVFKSNFLEEKATEAEREALRKAEQPVEAPLAQDYAAWRRAVLYIAAVALVVWSVIEIAALRTAEDAIIEESNKAIAQATNEFDRRNAEQQRDQVIRTFGKDNLELLDTASYLVVISLVVGTIMVGLAARSWADIHRSRRLTRVGFLVLFLTPFVLAAVPWARLMDFGHLQNAEQVRQIRMLLGGQLGFAFFLLVGPRALALFPGIIRSSMTLKTLLPESPMPGWAAAIVAPLYSIFLIVVVSTINQIGGDFKLLVGIACLMIAPLIYIYRAKDVLRPHSPDDVEKLVLSTRRQSLLFNAFGAVLVAVFILDLPFFTFADALKFFMGFVGNVLLLTVVGCDLMLALLHAGHRQTVDFEGSELRRDLDRRFEDLAGVGLTRIETGDRAKGEPA